jgi:putative transposase
MIGGRWQVTMRTLEFRLYPTRAQEQQLTSWLDLHRRIWNYGLALLQEYDSYGYYDKGSKARVPCCPVPWSYRWQKASDDTWQAIPYSEIRTHRKAGLSCPIPQVYRDPRLANDSPFGLGAFFAKKNHPSWPELQGCPNTLIRGTLQALATSWKEYKKGKRKIPRFKSARFPITTLSDTDCKRTAHVDGDTVKLPVLGELRIKGNRDGRRWPADLTVATYRLMREPSGWYLLLVGDVAPHRVRETKLAVAIDAGVKHTLTTSTGKHIDGPAALAAGLRKLKRLHQQMARQEKGSANWRKTVAKVALLHEKIRRTRKLFAHKATTYLLRTYDTVVIEDLKLANMVRRPAPKPAEDGSGAFLPNNAAAKGGLNRAMLDAGLGQIYTMLESKAADRGRTVERVNPAHTSQGCPACGVIDNASRISQELFRCTACGHTMNADHNAAVNILRRARPDVVVPMAPAPMTSGTHQLVAMSMPAATATVQRPQIRRRRAPAAVDQLQIMV